MAGLVTRMLAAAAGGLAATGPMTVVMEAVRRQLPPDEQHPLPPHRVTMRAAEAAGVKHEMNEGEKTAATAVAHFSFGAAAGAVYGVMAPHLTSSPVANGIGYGLAVWAGHFSAFCQHSGCIRRRLASRRAGSP